MFNRKPHGVTSHTHMAVVYTAIKDRNLKKDLIQNSYIMNNKRFINSNHANVMAAALPIHPTKPNDIVRPVYC